VLWRLYSRHTSSPRGYAATLEIFTQLGLDFDKHLRWTDEIFFRIGEKNVPLTQEGGVEALLSTTGTDRSETGRLLATLGKAMTWNPPSFKESLSEWLQRYSEDRRIRELFWGMSAAFLGNNLEETPASEFFETLKLGSGEKREMGIPPHGLGPMNNELAGFIERKGGEVWTGCRATGITVERELV
jgi:phytoene dehydrogenase-like protein